MSAYRTSAEMPVEPKPPKRRARLLRKGGCPCVPPGLFWCWWHSVGYGDHWECAHGALWRCGYSATWDLVRSAAEAEA